MKAFELGKRMEDNGRLMDSIEEYLSDLLAEDKNRLSYNLRNDTVRNLLLSDISVSLAMIAEILNNLSEKDCCGGK